MLAELVAIVAISLLSLTFYKWATLNNDFFKKRNMKYIKPTFLFGSTGGLMCNQYTPAEFLQKIYGSFPDEPLFGMFDFRKPQYIIRDPDLIKSIAVKSFDHFEDHEGFVTEDIDKLWGNSLLLMTGQKWRQMRATLSPAFTGSKMRLMFELVAECAGKAVKHYAEKIERGEKVNVETKDLFSRCSSDMIATCAFGLQVDSLVEPENEFYRSGKKFMDFFSFKQILRVILILQMPSVARAFGVSFTDKQVAVNFRNTILDTMEIRKKKNICRPDMINTMMEIREGTLKHQSEEKEKETDGFATVEESHVGRATVNRDWNDDEIVAQCFIFFIGGFDTTSTALMFASYEIAVNPDIQAKLYEEILETNEKMGGKRITYDALQKMKYLDQVICEVLRKWPSLPSSDRLCIKNYVHDDDKYKFKIDAGSKIIIPTYAIQNDPNYFSDPEKFDPERFSDENKDKIRPGTYLVFGIGPRSCIGSRFAIMVIKAILFNLLLDFSFEPNEQTQIPLKLKKTGFNMIPERGVHLGFKPRTK